MCNLKFGYSLCKLILYLLFIVMRRDIHDDIFSFELNALQRAEYEYSNVLKHGSTRPIQPVEPFSVVKRANMNRPVQSVDPLLNAM